MCESCNITGDGDYLPRGILVKSQEELEKINITDNIRIYSIDEYIFQKLLSIALGNMDNLTIEYCKDLYNNIIIIKKELFEGKENKI